MAYNEHPRWTPEQTLVREWLWSIAALEPPSREGSNIERALGLIDRYEDTPLCKLRVFQAEANYLMGGKCRAHVCWMVCRLMELQHGLLADNLDTTASASSLFYGQRIGTCNHNTTHEVDAITDVIPNSIYRHLKHLLELISTLAYMCKTLSEYSDPMMDDEGDTTRQAKDMEAERLMVRGDADRTPPHLTLHEDRRLMLEAESHKKTAPRGSRRHRTASPAPVQRLRHPMATRYGRPSQHLHDRPR
ncbi:hypothetical protein B0I35DRAFT_35573 [Stachybotrys elegans]|uniref:Uncharacterized protein n=1 Tax=Stachybotrys elegans TaxID=80388 RepID=A0A8K0T381_9HYPO|nr:hypothetical protein B0I35DRAFT_35573 [Stachybotrys elegans]